MRVLMIGALPPPLGGTTVSFKLLIEELSKRNDIKLDVLNVTEYRKFSTLLKLLFVLLIRIVKADRISIQLGVGALSILGFYISFLAIIFNKEISVRRFGGLLLSELSFFKRQSIKLIFWKANVIFCQTKEQLKELSGMTKTKIVWFPTSRKNYQRIKPLSNKCKNFVYIGQVKKTKGLLLLVDVFSELSETTDLTLSIYGPLFDGLKKSDLVKSNTFYYGELPPSDVYGTMELYDAVVLPSFYEGEGYPGILVEALHLKMPIISTRWKAIPELVADAALLVEPNNYNLLKAAVLKLSEDAALVSHLQELAAKRAELFSIEKQAKLFVENLVSR